jgi:hypothetical protein
MKRSTASRGAFAMLVALSVLPGCGIVLHGPPAMVFFIGAGFANDVSPRWGY